MKLPPDMYLLSLDFALIFIELCDTYSTHHVRPYCKYKLRPELDLNNFLSEISASILI